MITLLVCFVGALSTKNWVAGALGVVPSLETIDMFKVRHRNHADPTDSMGTFNQLLQWRSVFTFVITVQLKSRGVYAAWDEFC